MKIDRRFSVKAATNLSEGELFVAPFAGSYALGFTLKRTDSVAAEDKLLVALLSLPEHKEPVWFRFSADGFVASYGVGWRFRLLDRGTSFPARGSELAMKAGVITCTEKQTSLRLAASAYERIPRASAQVDLGTLQIMSGFHMIDSSTCIAEWQIWLEGEEPGRGDAEPFFKFKAV